MDQWLEIGRWVRYDGSRVDRPGWRIRVVDAHEPSLRRYAYVVPDPGGRWFKAWLEIEAPGEIQDYLVWDGASLSAAKDKAVLAAKRIYRDVHRGPPMRGRSK